MNNLIYQPYELLKTLISNKYVSEQLLEEYKTFFHDEIGFERKLASVQTISDLINLLEREDIVSEYNIRAFEDIVGELGDKALELAIANYVKKDFIPNENQYAIQRIKEADNENQKRLHKVISTEDVAQLKKESSKNACYSDEFIGKKRSEVFKLIARELGAKWRDFGRELGIRLSEMDNLEEVYPKDLTTRIYKMLESFENDPRVEKKQIVNEICEALLNARRRDLSIDVRKIMGR